MRSTTQSPQRRNDLRHWAAAWGASRLARPHDRISNAVICEPRGDTGQLPRRRPGQQPSGIRGRVLRTTDDPSARRAGRNPASVSRGIFLNGNFAMESHIMRQRLNRSLALAICAALSTTALAATQPRDSNRGCGQWARHSGGAHRSNF